MAVEIMRSHNVTNFQTVWIKKKKEIMKFQFNPNHQYQLDAISAVVDLFDGQKKTTESFGILPQMSRKILLFDDLGFSECLVYNKRKNQ